MSQPQLAEESGVPVGTIRDCEQRRRDPLLETAVKLTRALKQPVEAFLEDELEPQKKGKGKK
ncbi:MAG TPA: helix-turn-helix transcriptional regulator [Gemmataceae bacterium]